ncbi:iron-sulfur protein NUBPL [Senna tora]|uniref:Nucleotide-binding protein-like n=1 Tax=Senna tora TaxID=362788 RepID=A0A835CI68_9FABA|nr:iron-sulfur protein NUBPL [Senna tora]
MREVFGALRRIGSVRNYAKHLRIDGVRDTIAVASGKGGVGKTTTSGISLLHLLITLLVNLAVALASKCKLKVGLLDADVYGPNIPTMMNINRKPEVTAEKKMIPVENYGIKCMSMGFLVEKDAPIVWRGPMVANALEKMTRGVDWGNLDILVVDMPPGTGDVQIAMSQNLQLSGAVIVSTPQDVALMDARRGVNMFNKVDVPILGMVENMSCFKCPHCSEPSYIFGKGGTHRTAAEMGLEFLGEIPLVVEIREACDQGDPIVLSSPDSAVSKAYGDVAQRVFQKLKEQPAQPQIIL